MLELLWAAQASLILMGKLRCAITKDATSEPREIQCTARSTAVVQRHVWFKVVPREHMEALLCVLVMEEVSVVQSLDAPTLHVEAVKAALTAV